MTATQTALAEGEGKVFGQGVPPALAPVVLEGMSVVVERRNGTRNASVTFDDQALALLGGAPLVYRHVWPEVIVAEPWTEWELEGEALCQLEDLLHREGLRIVATPVLTWSAPSRDGTRWLVATCAVQAR